MRLIIALSMCCIALPAAAYNPYAAASKGYTSHGSFKVYDNPRPAFKVSNNPRPAFKERKF